MILIDFERAYDHQAAFDLSSIEGPPRISLQIPLPTEVVLTSFDERPVLRVGRVYETNLLLLWDEIRTYEQWREIEMDPYSQAAKKLALTEIWEDSGDDGHVDYGFRGLYRFWIEDELFAAYTKALRPSERWPYRSFINKYLGEPYP